MPTNPPEPNEIEVSLFGPGFGESAAVHLGCGEWLIVDSCVKCGGSTSAPLEYLKAIGVNPATAVKRIIATHWHNDHITGLAQTVRECSSAKFICSQALFGNEFIALTDLWKKQAKTASPLSEFTEILAELAKSGRLNKDSSGDIGLRFATANRCVWSRPNAFVGGVDCAGEVHSLSPSDAAIRKSYESIAALFLAEAHLTQPIPSYPNQLSVVLWIRIGGVRCLLGADMEEMHNPLGGWKLIVESPERPEGKASLYKVAHHGSVTGEHPPVWSDLLRQKPVAVVTPFHSGGTKLPNRTDVDRICNQTPYAYVTAMFKAKTSRSRAGSVNRTIHETVRSIRTVNESFGRVRARKTIEQSDEAAWRIELFGDACPLRSLNCN